MPPLRKLRRTATLSGSFYDKAGTFSEGSAGAPPMPPALDSASSSTSKAGTGSASDAEMDQDSDDDEYTLTGYGELSTDNAFTLPPSPTKTDKDRYRAYRPKLARLGKKYRKTKSNAYHSSSSDLSSILGQYASVRSPKRDFQALMQKYRDSAEGWRGDNTIYVSPRRMGSERLRPHGSSPLVRGGSGMMSP